MREEDDAALNLEEWNDFLEHPMFDVKSRRSDDAGFYVILLYDAVMLFDVDDWDAAMN